MAKKIGKFFWFAGGIVTLIFFVRFAWIRENQGAAFPTYITPLLIIVLAFVLVGFYIAGSILFDGKKGGKR